MRKFEELHIHDQIALIIATMEAIIDADLEPPRTLEKVASARGVTVLELWADICGETGFDKCEPWPGYPSLPRGDFSDAPGGSRPLPESAQPHIEEMERLIGARRGH